MLFELVCLVEIGFWFILTSPFPYITPSFQTQHLHLEILVFHVAFWVAFSLGGGPALASYLQESLWHLKPCSSSISVHLHFFIDSTQLNSRDKPIYAHRYIRNLEFFFLLYKRTGYIVLSDLEQALRIQRRSRHWTEDHLVLEPKKNKLLKLDSCHQTAKVKLYSSEALQTLQTVRTFSCFFLLTHALEEISPVHHQTSNSVPYHPIPPHTIG